MTPLEAIFADIEYELHRATAKFPTWPDDPIHAAAVVAEESGELVRAVLQATYEPGKADMEDVAVEAVQTAAMAVRFLLSMGDYSIDKSDQHEQATR